MSGVQFDLLAKDLISPVLEKIKLKARALDALVSGLAVQGPDLPDIEGKFDKASKSSSTFWGTFKANLATQALNQTLGLVQKLGSALGDASKFQTAAIASSSDISTNLGVGIAEARALVENTQIKIADVAAALPGVTKDYNDIFNAIGATIAEQHRGNAEAFQTASMEMTKRVGVLSSIRNISGAESGSAFNRLLAGTMGYGEARQLDLLQKNPMLQKSIERQLAAIGATTKQWTKLSQPQRYDVLMAALKDAVPDSLVNEFTGTTESILQTWQTTLLDPLKGIFGMMRRVKGASNRSTLDAFQGFLQSWDGFAVNAVKLAKSRGFDIDPMLGVIKIFDYLSDIGNRYTRAVDKEGKGKGFFNFSDVTSDVVADVINSVIRMVAGIDLGMLLQGFGHIIEVLFLALGKIDWGSLLVAGLKLLAIAVVGGLLAGLGLFISTLGAIPTALIAVSVAAVATIFVWSRRLVAGISNAFGKAWEGIESTLGGIWDGVKHTVSRFFEWVGSIFTDLKNKVTGFVTQPVQAISNMVPEPIKNAVGAVGGVGGIAKAAVSTINPLAGAAMGAIMGDPKGNLPQTVPSSNLQASNVFAPQVSIPLSEGSGVDPQAMANLVVDRLSQMYKAHQQGAIG